MNFPLEHWLIDNQLLGCIFMSILGGLTGSSVSSKVGLSIHSVMREFFICSASGFLFYFSFKTFGLSADKKLALSWIGGFLGVGRFLELISGKLGIDKKIIEQRLKEGDKEKK